VPVDKGDAALLRLVAGVIEGNSGEIGVAVSGGSDSVALLHLMAAAGKPVQAVTINHDLRDEAADEARFVAGLCVGLGVPHDVLVWDHGVVAGNLPDAARRARYGLMAGWARSKGVACVMLGHTADDQAETVLMGLARGAGLDGLCGMRASWVLDGVRFERPLLDVTRTELRGYLTRAGVGWVDDPTNDDVLYQRVKARQALAVLRPLGITVEGLGDVARNLAAARQALVAGVAEAAARGARESAGALILDRGAFLALPGELRRRLLIAALRWVSGTEYAPRAEAVLRLQAAIELGRDATLWGCRIRVGEMEIIVVREPKAVSGKVSVPGQLWDNRWRVEGHVKTGLEVRALGAVGLRACKTWRDTGLGQDALLVSPAIWRGETLIAAPLAGVSNGWTARIDAGFASFIISH
jgi:tRNA(Ile)-lysidine synthase